MQKNEVDAELFLEHLSGDALRVVKLVACQKSLREIAERVGLSEQMVESLIHKARFALGANDDLVDDYLHLIEQWSINCDAASDVERELSQDEYSSDYGVPTKILDELEGKLSSHEMRDVAGSLLRLADAIDQRWNPHTVRSAYSFPSAAARIEKQSYNLAQKAKILMNREESFEKLLPAELFNRPMWNMLLDLFIQFSGGAKVSVKSLSIAARCPATTALRYISQLEEMGLIERTPSIGDKRVVLCSLTKAGVVGVGKVLQQVVV